jgi:zinc/manganese transport system substrate-binding protein
MRSGQRVRAAIAAATAVTVAAVGGCSSAPSTGGSTGTSAPVEIAVVTTTDVWGSVVAQIGGSHVHVTAMITDPAADPHSFEASGQNQLAVAKAQLIVENGGGYDDFIDTMIASADAKAPVINAVTASGYPAPADGQLNEHVWYDFPTVSRVASAVAAALSTIDSPNAADYLANATTFNQALDTLIAREATIKAAHGGAGVAVTEPVPLYLVAAAGLVNKTPAEFSRAVEEGTDVPATVVSDTVKLFTDHQVEALVYNDQTTGPQTDAVLAAAKTSGVAIVPVTETLPVGKDYLEWMTDNVTALAAALT